MRIFEVIKPLREANVGRELQHLEDYLIVDGSDKVLNILKSLKDLVEDTSDASIKWDGYTAIYWGHDSQGRFYLMPKAQWDKSLKLTKQGLRDEITSTGRKRPEQSPEDFAKAREGMAHNYLRLWDIFKVASKGTQGFFKGDLMFSEPQHPQPDGTYVFMPNKVTYTVKPMGLYGKMPSAQAFITVHGKATEPGVSGLTPLEPGDIEKLNSTPALIALDRQAPRGNLKTRADFLDKLIADVNKSAQAIDHIQQYSAKGFTTLPGVLYNYAVKLGKSHDTLKFEDWLQDPKTKLSVNHKSVLEALSKTPEWKTFWRVFGNIKKAKHLIHDALHAHFETQTGGTLGISASVQGRPGGEGFVTSAGKIVNPYFRSAPDNPRFTGEA